MQGLVGWAGPSVPFILLPTPPITFHSFFYFTHLLLYLGACPERFSRGGGPRTDSILVLCTRFSARALYVRQLDVGLIQSMMLRTDWENELSKGNDFCSEFFFLSYIFFFFFRITMIKNTIEISFFLIHLMDPHS